MFAQLIVVDFSKGKRQVDFEKLAGHPRYIIAYYRDQAFENFVAYLFNYERLDNKALCEVAFMFEVPVNQKPDAPLDPIVGEMIARIDNLYRQIARVDLVAVVHHPRTTLCGYVPTAGLADIGQSLDWLMLQPNQETMDEQPPCGKDEQGTPESPGVSAVESVVDR